MEKLCLKLQFFELLSQSKTYIGQWETIGEFKKWDEFWPRTYVVGEDIWTWLKAQFGVTSMWLIKLKNYNHKFIKASFLKVYSDYDSATGIKGDVS